MITDNFKCLTDIFIEHYILSVLVGIIVLAATFIISVMHEKHNSSKDISLTVPFNEKNKEVEENQVNEARSHLKKPIKIAEKIIESKMTKEQISLEHEVRQKQLQQIYELMQQQSEKFGDITLSEVRDQFRLYQ